MSKFRQRIIEAYDSLTKRERQISDLLMDNPELTLLNSASDLARMAKVSNSTVTRFVQNIGFENVDAMRREMREEYGQGSPLSLVRPPFQSANTGFASEFARQEAKILESTFANLDTKTLDEAAKALVKAPQVGFLGMRNSHFFAAYAHWQFVQFRSGTKLLSGAGETSAEHLAGFKSGDAVVIVAVRRIVEKMRALIEILADRDVDILLIVDASSLNLAQRAKWTIVCPIENDHVFDSYSGVLGVLRLLSFTALQQSGEQGISYMSSVERYHDLLNEL